MTAQELVKKLQVESSYTAKAILALSQDKIDQLMEKFDPDADALIHICDEYFSINFGNAGSQGVNYEFYA
jgi:hypothetical protein